MPEDGLDEALDTLRSVFEFYVERLAAALPQPIESISGARLLAPVERAPLEIED
jgi:hypothetical protein